MRPRRGFRLESSPWSGTWAVTDAVLGSASPNRVSNAGSGSPNRLLYASAFSITAPRVALRSSLGHYTWWPRAAATAW